MQLIYAHNQDGKVVRIHVGPLGDIDLSIMRADRPYGNSMTLDSQGARMLGDALIRVSERTALR